MKIYQCIHKYPPHIPLFEAKNKINDKTNITFDELRKLIIEDGYASTYILQPALEGNDDEVFFTIWNYERLQFLWAKEHGIESRDLSVIKKAQIDWFKPDVFYNHSAFCDNDFIKKNNIDENIIKVCWYGIIGPKPELFKDYDIRVSLHRPYIPIWRNKGLVAYELQGAFVKQWNTYNEQNKNTDLLFYGQCSFRFFNNRTKLLDSLLNHSSSFDLAFHLSLKGHREPIVDIPLIRNRFFKKSPYTNLLSKSLPPLYGSSLYSAIGKTRFTLNGYTDFNTEFKSNMRLFESLGCGSLLLSEQGIYPEGFEDGKNYISYKDYHDLVQKLPLLLENYETIRKDMEPNINKLKRKYSKENQWQSFQNIITEFIRGNN